VSNVSEEAVGTFMEVEITSASELSLSGNQVHHAILISS
jgi:hypothetical protein